MKDDLYLAIFQLVLDHYIESCFEVPIYVKINIGDFDALKFNCEEVYLPNDIFEHIELEAHKDQDSWPFNNEVTIVMKNHPVLNTSKVFEA